MAADAAREPEAKRSGSATSSLPRQVTSGRRADPAAAHGPAPALRSPSAQRCRHGLRWHRRTSGLIEAMHPRLRHLGAAAREPQRQPFCDRPPHGRPARSFDAASARDAGRRRAPGCRPLARAGADDRRRPGPRSRADRPAANVGGIGLAANARDRARCHSAGSAKPRASRAARRSPWRHVAGSLPGAGRSALIGGTAAAPARRRQRQRRVQRVASSSSRPGDRASLPSGEARGATRAASSGGASAVTAHGAGSRAGAGRGRRDALPPCTPARQLRWSVTACCSSRPRARCPFALRPLRARAGAMTAVARRRTRARSDRVPRERRRGRPAVAPAGKHRGSPAGRACGR